jgi:hypothetical protein
LSESTSLPGTRCKAEQPRPNVGGSTLTFSPEARVGRILSWDGLARACLALFILSSGSDRWNSVPTTCRLPDSRSGPKRMLPISPRSRVSGFPPHVELLLNLTFTGWDYYVSVAVCQEPGLILTTPQTSDRGQADSSQELCGELRLQAS